MDLSLLEIDFFPYETVKKINTSKVLFPKDIPSFQELYRANKDNNEKTNKRRVSNNYGMNDFLELNKYLELNKFYEVTPISVLKPTFNKICLN